MAAEGIDISGKGVLQVGFDCVGNCDDVSSAATETTLRVPVGALEVMGFGHSEEVLSDPISLANGQTNAMVESIFRV